MLHLSLIIKFTGYQKITSILPKKWLKTRRERLTLKLGVGQKTNGTLPGEEVRDTISKPRDLFWQKRLTGLD